MNTFTQAPLGEEIYVEIPRNLQLLMLATNVFQ